MRPVDQTEFGERGNCVQACVASLLELPLEAVPHFLLDENGELDEHRAWKRMDTWLAGRGLERKMFYLWPGWEKCMRAQGFHLIGGDGPRSRGHLVVGCSGTMIHDPHPSRAGLVKPEEFWFLVKA